MNVVPDTSWATTFGLIATVILLPAPPSVSFNPDPAARTLSFDRDPVADKTTYCAALSAPPLPPVAVEAIVIAPDDPVVNVILEPAIRYS